MVTRLNQDIWIIDLGKEVDILPGTQAELSVQMTDTDKEPSNSAFMIYQSQDQKGIITSFPKIEKDDLIITNKLMTCVQSPTKAQIGIPFNLPAVLIKLSGTLIHLFGIKYLQYKVHASIAEILLRSHGFGKVGNLGIAEIANIRLRLSIKESKAVNQEFDMFQKRLVMSILKAVKSHEKVIQAFKENLIGPSIIEPELH